MSDLPVSLMSQQAYARPMSGEELELLGKAAAALYSRSGTPLTQAVVETVKHAGLGPEQVRRVAEFANVEAYQQEFQKQGNDHRYVQFHGGPADVPAILRDLNDGGGGTVFDRGLADYSHEPFNVPKTASRNLDRLGLDDQKLAQAFGVEDHRLPLVDPLGEAYQLYTKLADAREITTHEMGQAESVYADVVDIIFETVKAASLEGTPLGHIVQAWSTVTDDPAFIKAAFTVLTPRLMDNGVFPSLEHLGGSLEKIAANAVVDSDHPLVHDFRQFCELIDKIACLRIARDELTGSMDQLGTFLKGAIEKTGGVARQAWNAANQATASASEPVRRATAALAGPLAGKVVGGAVKHSPKILAALAAEEAAQQVQYNPKLQPVRSAGHFVAARVPNTRANLERKYTIASGG